MPGFPSFIKSSNKPVSIFETQRCHRLAASLRAQTNRRIHNDTTMSWPEDMHGTAYNYKGRRAQAGSTLRTRPRGPGSSPSGCVLVEQSHEVLAGANQSKRHMRVSASNYDIILHHVPFLLYTSTHVPLVGLPPS